ncbi:MULTISPECIES: Imm52 family immunity protein [Rhizobium]|uniref:Imm52 family immunity protein n=1 Tax=Rhizobium TaxID=379 RepID=UPI0007F0D453|nr:MULTISPECIES: Imm52 family immunity protein [Rhizobium]ANK91389.1 hypothetical protein AMK01_CH01922 [Rhizobium sp. N6212]ANK97422.1 hypothetical protein AMK00_CH01924 [Rhizobium sp. N621]ANL03542.1 hypothetical protein AMJ99_CH01992 [Rhizobium esperanzae]ANL09588.1 hypothetical protein AMJ98_CH01914 [Rhizobium sp. N1341]ANL21639.1 hypothetical protein AMJ96_CH01919 [Rhizobium sp. N113]
MNTRYKLLAYRDSRPRSPEQCATDLSVLLNRLAKISPAVFHWKLRGSSKRKAMQNSFIDPNDFEFLSDIVLKSANRRDGDHSIIPELGFSISFWNGSTKDESAASLSIANGLTSNIVPNSVVLNFPSLGYSNNNIEATVGIISAAVDSIDAERALLFREDLAPPSVGKMFLETAAFLADGFDPQASSRLAQEADEIILASRGKIFVKR